MFQESISFLKALGSLTLSLTLFLITLLGATAESHREELSPTGYRKSRGIQAGHPTALESELLRVSWSSHADERPEAR